MDGRVNVSDLVHLLDHWLGANASTDNNYYERADLNLDGMVDLQDLALLALHWMEE